MAKREVPARWKGTPAEPYYMNEKKCRALIKKYGSQRKAAAAIGVAHTTFLYWSDNEYAEQWRKQARDKRVNNPKWYVQKKLAEYARNRKRYASDPEYREKCLRWRREKRLSDPEYVERERLYRSEYRRNNRDRLNKQARERRANDPERAKRYRIKARETYKNRYANDLAWVERQRERKRKYMNSRYKSDPEYAERKREQQRERVANDPVYRAKQAILGNIRNCRKRIAAKKRRLELLNEELQKCVESLT